jgi:hypothetical protein
MPLDATVGGASANSYLTVAEADAYFQASYNKPKWAGVAANVKETLLMESTRLLDLYVDWKGVLFDPTVGSISNPSQALRWPRYWAEDLDGRLIDSATIPDGVKNLVCELAYSILSSAGYKSDQNPLDSIRLSTITIKFNNDVIQSGFPQSVVDMISVWGTYRLPTPGAAFCVPLVRV